VRSICDRTGAPRPTGKAAPLPVGDALPAHGVHAPIGTPRTSRRSRWRAGALIAVHLAVLAHLAHWKIAGSTLTPLEPSEGMQTLELGYVNAGFIVLGLSIVATLLLGRFFCGWLCHVVAYQDLCAWLLGKIGVRPRPVRSRLLAFVPIGAALYMFVWPRLSAWLAGRGFPGFQAHFTTESFWATFPGPGIAALTILVDGFLIVYLLGAKGFCTYGCPYGALFGVADRFSRARIRVTDACNGCGHCTTTCTSNVQVHQEVALYRQVVDAGCMKCMDCVSVCPTDALYWGLGESRGAALARAKSKPPSRFDFGWGEELVLACVFLIALYALRGLYGLVPFLLAIGLSVITAVVAVAFWRLLRSRSFSFQSHRLRMDGRWTARGVLASIAAVGLLALVGHSAIVQYERRSGERDLNAASALPRDQRGDLLGSSLAHLAHAQRLGLLPVGTLELQIGSILREQGDVLAAEARFRRAIEIDPSLKAPRLALADLLIVRRELGEARRVLEDLLAFDPTNNEAQRRLVAVRAALDG
jgi:polyferredoxin